MSLYGKKISYYQLINVTLNKKNNNNLAFILDTPRFTRHTHNNRKEMSLIAHMNKLMKKGSITVETALVLPVFLFAFISLIYLGVVIQYTNCVEQGIHQVAKDLAVKSYAVSKADIFGGAAGKATGVALSETYVRGSVDKYLEESLMKPGNIYYFRSSLKENDVIDIIAEEKVKLPYSFLGINDFYILERARVHAWTGYDVENINNNGEIVQEEVVYVTSHGSVFHRNRNCIHLKVTPKPVGKEEIATIRNESGSKYYSCEYCGNNSASGVVYITDFGNRFHSKVNCGALSRDISSVLISEVGSRRACKDCG